ncbi:MBL fold metallo-hydrolase [Candidatus Micrarchaeota archaeon]|nr:MBL fold metallo-hydrolase [Candidatus Micrarchaeota archaeon]
MTLKTKIKFYGGTGEVGRNAILVKTDRNILLDFGAKQIPGERQLIFPEVPDEKVDAVILSHAHLDHVGGLPYLFSKTSNALDIPIYSTLTTKKLTTLLLDDSVKIGGSECMIQPIVDIVKDNLMPISLNKTIRIGETTFSFFSAGHIPGSAMVDIRFQDERIIYTGDFCLNENRLLMEPADLSAFQNIDIPISHLITESTYSNAFHQSRDTLERKFIESVKAGLETGCVVLPSFAIERTAEILRVLLKHFPNKQKIYVDGMGIKATKLSFNSCDVKKSENLFQNLKQASQIATGPNRKKAISGNNIIITTAGMGEGGPFLWYANRLFSQDTIIFTGYCVEGSNGRKLIDGSETITVDGIETKVSASIRQHSFSAHPDKTDLIKLYRLIKPENIFVVHGENTEEFSKELEILGYNSKGPKIFDEY